MKNKLITIIGSLIAIFVVGGFVSAQTIGPGATWFFSRGLLKPIQTVTQVLIGGTATTTDADLEIQGSIGLNGNAITDWSSAGTNYWSDDGTTLSPVTSTRTLTIPSLNPGECVQVGVGGVLTGAGASCAATSSAPEADPIFMAASNSLPYVKTESDPVFTAVSTTYLTTTTASSTYFKISDWLLQTTDNLVEGVTNLYFTIARAREAISSLIPAITYSTSTGQFSLTSGYEIPLSASTTNWNNTYNTVNSSSTLWDTAYSWGNHALAGYLTSISGLNISLLNNDSGYITTTPAETDPVWSAASSSYLTSASATATYLTQSNAAITYQPIGSYVTGTPWTLMGYVTGSPWTLLGYVTGTPWRNEGYVTSSITTETDPIWTAASPTVGFLAKENIWTGLINTFQSVYASLVSSTNALFSNVTTTNLYSSNLRFSSATGTNLYLSGNLTVAGTTTVVNVTSTNITVTGNATTTGSQYVGSLVIDTLNGLLKAANGIVSVATAGVDYIVSELDPVWSAVSTTVAYLSNNQTFTGENTFTATTSLSYGSWIGDTLGSKSIQFTDYTIPTTFAAGNQINKISAKNDLNFLAMENALFVFADTGTDPLIGLGREDSNYLTLMGTSLDDNDLSIYQIDETVTQVNYSDFAIGTEKISLISGSVTSTLNFNNNAEISLSPTDVMNFSGASGYYFDATTTATCFTVDGVNCFDATNYWTSSTDYLIPTVNKGVSIADGSAYWYNNIKMAYASTTNYNYFLWSSGNTTMTGGQNIGIGSAALDDNTEGTFNIAIGSGSLTSNTTGILNIGVGFNSLNANLTGLANTGIGFWVLGKNTIGSNNLAIGSSAMFENTEGSGNTALGTLTLEQNTTGNFNTAVSQGALRYNTNGEGNVAIGINALGKNTTGSSNVSIGNSSLYNSTVGGYNVAIGVEASYNANYQSLGVPSQNNLAIGYKAGYYNVGSRNTFIGNEADVLESASSSVDSIAIGAGIKVGASFATAVGGQSNVVSGAYSGVFGGKYVYNSGILSNTFGGSHITINGSSYYSTALGGQYVTVTGYNSGALATAYSTSSGNYSLVVGGSNNIASGNYTSVFNSMYSQANGTLSSVYNSLGSYANGTSSMVLGGQYNLAEGSGALILNSASSQASGEGAIIINSTSSIASGFGSTILSGENSTVSGGAAGLYNSTLTHNSSTYSSVITSYNSLLATSSFFSFMAGASSSQVWAPRDIIIGGDSNIITAAYGTIINGIGNTVSGIMSYAMGSGMTVYSPYSFGINLDPTTTSTLAQTSTMAIMGGKVGIGTTTPEDDLVIDNGITIEDDNYYSNYSKYGHREYLSLIDATLYSSVYGYASTTSATDTDPYNNIGILGQGDGVWDIGVGGINMGGGVAGIMFNYSDANPSLLLINGKTTGQALAVQSGISIFGGDVQLPNITDCSQLGTNSSGTIVCMDLAGQFGSSDVADQVIDKIKAMSFWEKILLLFF